MATGNLDFCEMFEGLDAAWRGQKRFQVRVTPKVGGSGRQRTSVRYVHVTNISPSPQTSTRSSVVSFFGVERSWPLDWVFVWIKGWSLNIASTF